MGEAGGRANGTSGASGDAVAEVVVGRAVVVAEASQGLDVALHKISTALDRTPLPDVARFRKQAVAK